MHSVEKNSLIYAQLSTLAWAACGFVPTDWFEKTLNSSSNSIETIIRGTAV